MNSEHRCLNSVSFRTQFRLLANLCFRKPWTDEQMHVNLTRMLAYYKGRVRSSLNYLIYNPFCSIRLSMYIVHFHSSVLTPYVSLSLVSAEQVKSCGIYGGQSVTGVGFLWVLLFLLAILIPLTVASILTATLNNLIFVKKYAIRLLTVSSLLIFSSGQI
jgi:hypothetical protein